MDLIRLKDILEKNPRPTFASILYRAKKHNELARYTLRLNTSYRNLCAGDLLELEIRYDQARGIEKVVLGGLIDSFKESIAAMDEGREHVNYTKRGMYLALFPNVKIFKDGTLEIAGLQHAKTVIEPGEYTPVNYRSEETKLRAAIVRELKRGQFKTLCIDAGRIHNVRVNGEEWIFE